ncbi:hypothetical protein RHMOL_Rhmol08G0171400 [Rhododendron molle]|uniref:Uncharacterized protein n=1 Tax=Rhododendron molle TaxID=49168 RepID=A0ACC0MQU2_RHOML|nr:hypothetical protein RHMOL_Rhmol08G0171400 [Rhododendron molle]
MLPNLRRDKAGARALVNNATCKGQEQEIEELRKALATREDDMRVARGTCDLYLANFQRCDRERVVAEIELRKPRKMLTL